MKFFRKLWDKWQEQRIYKRTGRNKAEREYDAWCEANVNHRADCMKQMFAKFKHVIVVDADKFLDPSEPFGWYPVPEARQYFWPRRGLGENCVWRIERVIWDKWQNDWMVNGIGDEDLVFVATNSDADAMMITLTYK